MVDITHKSNSLRTAVAQAIVKVGSQDTIEAIIKKNVPKGDVFEVSKIAGLFAVKNTSNAIPDCHPLPIEFTSVSHDIQDLNIQIIVTVKTIYKTGVEVEAMHGASIVALTMYDMLKPIDKSVEIHSIKLIEKKGGKSEVKTIDNQLKIGIIVCSDSISAGKKTDSAGKTIIKKIQKLGLKSSFYKIIPDEVLDIQLEVMNLFTNQFDLVIITGGTGLSARDITPEAIIPLLDKRIPGIEETIRNYGQQRTPYAMLSRSVVGFRGNTLIMALPGSTNGAGESIDAVFPSVLHLFKIIKGFNHNQ
ncbi:bifunctional molybdenum cofactor biosynthesis protein MoaC/MoaB [Flavobacterium columnare NBRC 100251 = ATCC 23463]|uniref:Molybdopterin adenylyltransferase n=1 Tax=Flavobacterium columnare (strain ATCC 49512 / CIP 103533 / TG 44/87) TaxID=1041826 RepID=G8XAY8_FLACA|nr:bifunctional molybdenum cofactor biosynthesis protein MoaC/MoaB [Flavobacterium columnare]AEW85260.1 bifunctional molybdenum cofactor biosynthesis protein MoaC/MogA [Flavobacterium columnare ATCC 49512]PDS25602.1 bifunctional molybdenum cofactor biosynthesis protein MoaC/MoaB [Flavobacterium columnare NBRC 100251 = ATCC 23463]GEM57366.1 bifunctional molybdenum cofactor biosynthesis protein MoaC/MoaB [Flavobacterium columnare NBRC 100251 = ATCC 23463]